MNNSSQMSTTEARNADTVAGLRRVRSMGDLQPPRTSRRHHRDRIRHSQHPLGLSDARRDQILNRSTIGSPSSATPPDASTAAATVSGMWAPPPLMMQQLEEAQAHHRGAANLLNQPQRQHNLSWYSKIMAFFGYGRGASHSRRLLVSLLWNLALGFAQFVVIVALLAVSANTESPTMPGLTEWTACSRPLGVWCCLWVGRVALACVLTYWGWKRDREGPAPNDAEAANTEPSLNQTNAGLRRQSVPQPTSRPSRNSTMDGRDPRDPPPPPIRPILYTRLSLLSSLLTLSWFLTAHILEYTSINTCRFSSPHLWWLVFGILCLMYIMVLEVVLIGFVVFVIAPILFLCWNILLMCLGRHPLQNPSLIKPEIGKLPKSVVDRIPLVMYIPPSPEDSKSPVTVPEAVHAYPPKTTVKPSTPSRRFKFLRISRKKQTASTSEKGEGGEDKKSPSGKGAEDPQTWENQWVQSEYPFVKLEGNRAACAICLMDFEEPKRVQLGNEGKPMRSDDGKTDSLAGELPATDADTTLVEPSSGVQEIGVETPSSEIDEDKLRLTDAGEGAQPLRLLACGHVFHKTCLDPWLIDVSGRCPVCQRAVQVPAQSKKKNNGNRNRS
ncbi:RING-type domain-containing protein [Pleurotus pulmonarius]